MKIWLPVHKTYYGDIADEDLFRFLACAGEALRTLAFWRKLILYPDTDFEKELWVKNAKGDDEDYDDVYDDVEFDWLACVDDDTDTLIEKLARLE